MSRNKVLVVDDESGVRFGIRDFLEQHGYEIEEADSCLDAQHLFRSSRPDIVIADYMLPDGTALGDVRYTLQTDGGALRYVQSRGVRHGSAKVLARLSRGEDVDPSEYTFRTSTQIETASSELDWLDEGVLVSGAGRLPGGVIYETYLLA